MFAIQLSNEKRGYPGWLGYKSGGGGDEKLPREI